MNAVDLLLEVIRDHSPASKWTDAPLESFRRVENTNRGEIGEHFIRRYLERNGIETQGGSRLRPTDLTIAGRLVRMAEGQSVTFKLTKRLADMRPIDELPEWVRSTVLAG